MLRPPQTRRAFSRVHVSDCAVFELFDIHSQAPGVRIRGAKGHRTAFINGLYALCEKPYCGFPKYRKETDPNCWLYRLGCGTWMVTSTENRNPRMGKIPSAPGVRSLGEIYWQSKFDDAELPHLGKYWSYRVWDGYHVWDGTLEQLQVEAYDATCLSAQQVNTDI